MSLVELAPQTATSAERSTLQAVTGIQPVSDSQQQEQDQAGFIEGTFLSSIHNTLLGNTGKRIAFGIETATNDDNITLTEFLSNGGDPAKFDPNAFDPMQYATPEFFEQHPYMKQHFDGNNVWELTTHGDFWSFVEYARITHEDTSRIGTGAMFTGAILGDLPLALLAGGGNNAKKAKSLIDWMRKGNLPTRLGKAALVGGGGNAAYESIVQTVDPVDEADAESLLTAAAFGTALASAAPLLASGAKNTVGRSLPTTLLHRLQKDMQRATVKLPARDIRENLDHEVDALKQMLDEAPVADAHRSTIVTPETEPLLKQIRSKYADEGFEFSYSKSDEQPVVDALLGLDLLDKEARTLSKLDDVKGMFAEVVASIVPETRMRLSSSEAVRNVYALINDSKWVRPESMEGVAAEVMRRGLTNRMYQARNGIENAYREHFKQGGQPFVATMSDGTEIQVNRRFNQRQFGEVVDDYIRQKDQIRRGLRDEGDFSTDFPESVVKAADEHGQWTRDTLDELEDAGILQGPKALQRAKSELQELEDRSQSLHAAIEQDARNQLDAEIAGEAAASNLTQTQARDAIDSAMDAEDFFREPDIGTAPARPSDRRPIQRIPSDVATIDTLDVIPEGLIGRDLFSFKGPGDIRLQKGQKFTYKGRSRRFLPPELIDKLELVPPGATDLIEAVERIDPRAVWRIGGTERRGFMVTKQSLEELRRLGIDVDSEIDYGRKLTEHRGRAMRVGRERNEARETFVNMVLHEPDRFGPDVVAAANRSRMKGRPPKPKGVKAADELAKVDAEIAARRADVDDLQGKVEAADTYLTRRWLAHEIKNNESRFVDMLKQQFNDNRSRVDIEDRAIIPEVLDRLDENDRNIIIDFDTEADIRDFDSALWQNYNAAVNDYVESAANSTFRTLTGLDNTHGVQSAIRGSNPLKGRILDIDESRFREFIDTDLMRKMEFYDMAVSGRAAVAKALRNNESMVMDLVRKHFPNKSDGTPTEIADVINSVGMDGGVDMLVGSLKSEYQALLTAANNVDRVAGSNLAKTVRRQQDRIFGDGTKGGAIDVGIREVLGQSVRADSPAVSVGWRAVERIALKMPFLASGGGFLMSSVIDASTMALMGRKSKEWFREVGKKLDGIHGLSRWGVEAVEATGDEAAHTRQFANFDIDNMPLPPQFKDTMVGRMFGRIDQGGEVLARVNNIVNGMNWWNRNWRRIHARGLLYDTFKGMQAIDRLYQIADVDKVLKSGDDKAIRGVLRQAGFDNIQQLNRLKRMGFNADNSRKLLRIIRENGTDIDGNPLSRLSDDEFRNWKRLYSPEYHRWAKSNRKLFDFFTGTIDSELRAMIAEPNILSRPLMNRTMFGKMFNMFWTFAMAWGNQTLPVAAQGTNQQFGSFVMSAVGLGAMVDAIKAHLSGQRSLEETGRLWNEKPVSMAQASIFRSGILSWIARPLEMANNVGIGVPQAFGEDTVRGTTHISRSLDLPGTLLGPTVDIGDRLLRGIGLPMLEGRLPNNRDLHMVRTAMPFQNNLFLRSIYRFTNDIGLDNPFGPGKGVDLFPVPTQPEWEYNKTPREVTP